MFTDDEGPLRSEFQVANAHFVEVVLRPPITRYQVFHNKLALLTLLENTLEFVFLRDYGNSYWSLLQYLFYYLIRFEQFWQMNDMLLQKSLHSDFNAIIVCI